MERGMKGAADDRAMSPPNAYRLEADHSWLLDS